MPSHRIDLSYIKSVENPDRVGRDQRSGVWTPYRGVDGTLRIGYGHRVAVNVTVHVVVAGTQVRADLGITDDQVNWLLEDDAHRAANSAQRATDGKYGTGTFSKYNKKQQTLLVDKQLALGAVGAAVYREFNEAVHARDFEKAARSCSVSYHVGGVSHPDERRNERTQAFCTNNPRAVDVFVKGLSAVASAAKVPVAAALSPVIRRAPEVYEAATEERYAEAAHGAFATAHQAVMTGGCSFVALDLIGTAAAALAVTNPIAIGVAGACATGALACGFDKFYDNFFEQRGACAA